MGGEPEGKMHGHLFCSQNYESSQTQMFPSEIVNPYITLLYLWGFRAYKSPAHFMWTTIRFTENSVDNCHKGHIV